MALTDKTSSFGLVRTNPKITGNVKITIDSGGDVWLNTINATKELSSSDLKKFRTTTTSTYAQDLKKFVGKLPPEIIFAIKPGADPGAISTSFRDQYDLFYAMGVQPLISDAYNEDYSYFAPIWLRDTLPDYFVIFRVNDPLDFPYNKNVEAADLVIGKEYKVVGTGYSVIYDNQVYVDGDTFTTVNNTFYTINVGTGLVVDLDENKDFPIDHAKLFDDLVKKAEIVETFDLTSESKIGKYIRRIKDDQKFPQSPITVRFEEGLLTAWNGIAYQNGSMTTKGERLDKFWEDAQSQIDFEDYITKGFERQGVISPFMLNLEFLFDDETADMYTIPRYFGFYVNKTVLGTFQLDGQELYDQRNVSGNTPLPKRPDKGFRYQDDTYYQNNEDGVRLFYENSEGIIPDSTFFEPLNFEPRFYWIQDKLGKFYSLDKLGAEYNLTNADLVLRNKSINLGDLSGPYDLILQGKGSHLNDKGRSYMTIKVKGELFPNDKIRIYWNIGSQTDVLGKFDEITGNDLRRLFQITPNGTVVSILGDVSTLYSIGDELGITYAPKNRTTRTVTSAPIFGGTYTTFTINQPINLTATEGYIDIEPGWGVGSSLSSYSNNPIYFHPFGTVEDVARAIANAFNELEQRNFDAIAIGDTCVIRMRTGQSITNTFFSTFNVTLPERLEVQGRDLLLAPLDKYNFEGGTDKANTRLKVDIDDTEKLTTGEVYVKTQNGISKIVHVGRFVDDAVQEAGGSDLVNIDGFNDYAVLTIEDILDTPIIGSTKEYAAYTLFRIPVGVFSVFNIKDMDGDFWSSDYNKSPLHEFKRYFNIPSGEGMLVVGRTYYIFSDSAPATTSITHGSNTYYSGMSFVATESDFVVNSGTPFVVAQIFFRRSYSQADILPGDNMIGTTYEILGDNILDTIDIYDNSTGTPVQIGGTLSAGTTFTLMAVGSFVKATGSATVIKLVTPAAFASEIDSADVDLKSFPGFSKFKDFLTIEDENVDKNTVSFKLNDKYFFNDLNSEYDYLKENFNKELSTKSRLFQYISKWVFKGGLDVRDNPYRLNTHPVFGTFNFAPSYTIKTQNPEAFSHEWYYLEGTPNQYSDNYAKDNYYFFPDKLDYSKLVDANPNIADYFSQYFTFQPTADSPLQERYTIFDYNAEIGLAETFFRGVKIRVKEIVRDTQAPELRGVKPSFKQKSTTFDGYKFTSILRVKKETAGIIETPVEIQVVENDTAKTITMIIDVIIDDYRVLNLDAPGFLGSSGSPSISYPETLEPALDYTLLYTLKSKALESIFTDSSDFTIKGLDAHEIGDIKLSVALDFSSPSGAIGAATYVNVFDNPDYDWDLRDEVKNFNPVNYMYGEFQYGATRFDAPTGSTQNQVLFAVPGSFQAPTPINISIPFGSNYEWNGFTTYQKEGGKLYLEPIMQRISFAKIAEKINEYSRYIKYKSFKWNGFFTEEIAPKFYIEFVEPSTVMKKNSLLPIPDDDKPEEFANEPVIGTVLTRVNSAQTIRRYGGPYEPKFRNVFHFKDQISDALTTPGSPSEIFDLSFQQATFNPHVEGFGFIKNFGYLKVANSDILSLVNNNKYDAVYPLVNEIAIDRIDFPVYQSSWDPGFWRKFINKSTYKHQAGTREMLEVKNFLASKVMKTPKTIQLQEFNVTQISDISQVNINTFTDEIVFAVQTPDNSIEVNKIVGYINVKSRLIRYLIEDGADTVFAAYLMPEFGIGDPDVLTDDVVEYLNLNVIPTFQVNQVLPYVRLYKQTSLALPYVDGTLDDVEKVQNGYKPVKDFTTNKISDFVYRFEYNIEPSQNASLAITLDVGKI